MINLEPDANVGPEQVPTDPPSNGEPISASLVNTDSDNTPVPSNSESGDPKSVPEDAATPPVDTPAVASAPSDKSGDMIMESTPGGATSCTGDRPPKPSIKNSTKSEGSGSDPKKSLDSLISSGPNPRSAPTRRRSYDDDLQNPPVRRKSLRDKVLSNIIDNTLGAAISHVTNDTTSTQEKYISGGSKSPRPTPPRSRERRSSFGDAQPQKRRGSIRDKILGHIIQAAVMGVGHNEEAGKKETGVESNMTSKT